MCVTAQSNNAGCAHYCIVDCQRHYAERVTIVKLREINQDMASRHARAVVHDPARIQGGNWKMQGFRRSGHVHDEAECQMSIAEFMAEQALQHDTYDG
jgi:hypothetical protein